MSKATETLPKELEKDKANSNYKELFEDVLKYLNDPKNSQSKQSTIDQAKDFLEKLHQENVLPNLTITDYDDKDGDGRIDGLVLKDTFGGKSEEYIFDPATGIARDTQGRVQAYIYPNGTIQRFDYDDKGNLTKVTDAEGAVYQLKDGKWTGPNGEVQPPKFSADGKSLILTTKEGTEEHFPDGSAIIRNQQGQVTGVLSAMNATDKNVRTLHTLKYDGTGPDAHPVSVTISSPDRDGSQTWTLQPDGSWKLEGSNVTSNAKFSVDRDTGAITIENKDGSKEQYNRDGTSKITNADKSIVEKDRNGHVTKITRDGETVTFDWNNDVLNKMTVRTASGTKEYTFDGTKWIGPDKKEYKSIVVLKNGDIELQSDKESEIWKPNGWKVTLDERKNPTAVYDQTGKKVKAFKYDQNGVLTEIKINEITYKPENGRWKSDFGDIVDIGVDSMGNVSIKSDESKSVTYLWNNGTYTLTDGAGGEETFAQNGQLIKVRSGGRDYHVTFKTVDGKTYIARVTGPDGYWSFDANGTYVYFNLRGQVVTTPPGLPTAVASRTNAKPKPGGVS